MLKLFTMLTAKYGWDIQYVNIITAFLNSRLDRELYIK